MKFLNMKKSLLTSAVLTLGCVASTPAFAGGGLGFGFGLGAGAAATKFFVGGNVGVSNLDPQVRSCCGTAKSADTNNNGLPFKLSAGYNINKKLSIEGFFNDLGSTDVTLGGKKLGTASYQNYGIAAVYAVPVSKKINLRGKLGYGKLESEFKGTVKHEKKNENFIYKGVGAEYKLTPSTSMVIDYDHFGDAQLLSIGIKLGFF